MLPNIVLAFRNYTDLLVKITRQDFNRFTELRY